ncbi:MAG: isoprenylcysteine carboxylmethyltransferase family protein [Burkholderiales bacterium]|nr:isoprenylcysteine carboxylmethyltransferase family protein [Burkholderiales bacterium]
MDLPIGLQSRLWVAAQFVLIAAMVLWPADWRWHALAILLGLAALALGLWVFVNNRPGNFNIRPEPKSGGQLITGGPYAWVRHPMYVALLLGMAGVAAGSHSLVQAGLWLWLLIVLHFKAALEERLLRQRWPDYAAYAQRTRRFIPGVW